MPSEQSFVNHAKEQAALSQHGAAFWEKFKIHGGSKTDYINSVTALTEDDLKTIQDGGYQKNTQYRDSLLADLNEKMPAHNTAATLEMRKRHEDIAHRVVVYGIKPDLDCKGSTCGTTGLWSPAYDPKWEQPTQDGGSQARADTLNGSVESENRPLCEGYHKGRKDLSIPYARPFHNLSKAASDSSGIEKSHQVQQKVQLPESCTGDVASLPSSYHSARSSASYPKGWLGPDSEDEGGNAN